MRTVGIILWVLGLVVLISAIGGMHEPGSDFGFGLAFGLIAFGIVAFGIGLVVSQLKLLRKELAGKSPTS